MKLKRIFFALSVNMRSPRASGTCISGFSTEGVGSDVKTSSEKFGKFNLERAKRDRNTQPWRKSDGSVL